VGPCSPFFQIGNDDAISAADPFPDLTAVSIGPAAVSGIGERAFRSFRAVGQNPTAKTLALCMS
jgi:hypothetical protein